MGSIVARPFTNPVEKEIYKLKNIFKLWCWKLKLKLTVSRKLSPRSPATVITTRTIHVYRQTKLKFFICMVRAPHDDIINSEHFL